DHTRLAGRRFGQGTTAIVLAHQSDGELCQWATYAERLARIGYLALAFDFRGYGHSQTRHYPANQRWGGDVAAAVRFVRAHGARKVFLLGASLGGSAVIQAAANVRPAVTGVVSVSGAADLSNAIESVKDLRAPVLFLAGEGDRDFAADARRLDAAAASTQKQLRLYPSAARTASPSWPSAPTSGRRSRASSPRAAARTAR